MKLKSDYITQEVDDAQFLVGVGSASFNGIIRSNRTAAFIVDCLRKNTTEEAIVDAMLKEYDAPREVIARDVKKVLETLRSVSALEE